MGIYRKFTRKNLELQVWTLQTLQLHLASKAVVAHLVRNRFQLKTTWLWIAWHYLLIFVSVYSKFHTVSILTNNNEHIIYNTQRITDFTHQWTMCHFGQVLKSKPCFQTLFVPTLQLWLKKNAWECVFAAIESYDEAVAPRKSASAVLIVSHFNTLGKYK